MEIYDKKNELSRKYSIINSPEHSGYLKKYSNIFNHKKYKKRIKPAFT